MKKRRRTSIPEFIRPQLARLVETPPSGDEWIHEVKYDGYRVLCRIESGRVTLRTRNGLDWTKKFQGLVRECAKIDAQDAIIDGEIVAIDEDGRTSFSGLQKALSEERTDRLVYYAFDLLYLDGKDLQDEPLIDRKRALAEVIERSGCDRVLFSDHWRSDGRAMLKASCRHRLEGIISKNANDTYHSGRGDSWLKSKCTSGQEFVIGGFTRPKGSRSGFGALLLGVYEPTGELRYVGRVGTGFDSRLLDSLSKKLRALESETSPFKAAPADRDVRWVEPSLVANIEFTGWTADNHLRHASFQGLREDKTAPEVVKERPRKKKRAEREREIRLSHPDRIVFPELKIKKKTVFDYYENVADRLLPFIEERPLSVIRCPGGTGAACFFQKHTEGSGSNEALSISTKQELLEWVQLGALEFHPWGSRIDSEELADTLVFDLDPGDGVSWKQMVQAAIELRDLLRDLGLQSFLKLSGGKGLHLQVPIAPRYPWASIKAFCKSVATEMSSRDPARYTAQLAKAKRKGRIFIDYLRNGRGATAVAPYSLRARKEAGVALPISWNDLESTHAGDEVSLLDFLKRKSRGRDPWAEYHGLQQPIQLLETHAKTQTKTAAKIKGRSKP